MLETLGRVIRIISLAVAGIGAISLLVGAIGILTMMWISVHERTSEIGLAKAIGIPENITSSVTPPNSRPRASTLMAARRRAGSGSASAAAPAAKGASCRPT